MIYKLAVVCPGYSFKDNTYCDCDSDCDEPMCSCPEARACCGNKGILTTTLFKFDLI